MRMLYVYDRCQILMIRFLLYAHKIWDEKLGAANSHFYFNVLYADEATIHKNMHTDTRNRRDRENVQTRTAKKTRREEKNNRAANSFYARGFSFIKTEKQQTVASADSKSDERANGWNKCVNERANDRTERYEHFVLIVSVQLTGIHIASIARSERKKACTMHTYTGCSTLGGGKKEYCSRFALFVYKAFIWIVVQLGVCCTAAAAAAVANR